MCFRSPETFGCGDHRGGGVFSTQNHQELIFFSFSLIVLEASNGFSGVPFFNSDSGDGAVGHVGGGGDRTLSTNLRLSVITTVAGKREGGGGGAPSHSFLWQLLYKK